MQYFMDTTETIPEGVGFDMFGTVHLIWLGAFVLAAVLCSLYYRSLDEKGRSLWRKVIAILLVLDEVYKQVFLLIGDRWGAGYLPLHLCSVNIFIVAYHAFCPKKLTGNFLYTVCIPGALAALLFPSWTALPAANFMHTHSFTVHILLALYPIVLTAAGEIRPDIKLVPKCVGMLLIMAFLAWLINPLLNANFFFMAEAGSGNPLQWFEENWGNHLLGFPVLVSAIVLVMHSPWVVVRRLKN